MQNVILTALVVLVALFIVHQYNPHLFASMGVSEGFYDAASDAEAEAKKKEKAAEEARKKAELLAAQGSKQGSTSSTSSDSKVVTGKAAGSKFKDGEGFADLGSYEGPAQFSAAEAPAGCYPRDQLTPSELLPKDMASIWAEQNPMGPGSLKGKNFLSAGALIGVNTVGQSMRNANLQVRSEPPNPQVAVSIFNQSTISPDISHRPLEIGA